LAAFALGVVVGPQIHAMLKACQDDHGYANTDEVVNSGEGRGGLGKCFPTETKTDLKWDPLIPTGEPKKPKRKGKRKGK
jgi:hypothetical protein